MGLFESEARASVLEERLEAQAGDAPGLSSTAEPTSVPHVGVSFGLEAVGFALPDGKKLLKDISFGIAAGRRVAVMGPSGSGKTTLLGVLSGRASYGRVTGKLTVAGRPADDMRRKTVRPGGTSAPQMSPGGHWLRPPG
eukprot:g33358.t1